MCEDPSWQPLHGLGAAVGGAGAALHHLPTPHPNKPFDLVASQMEGKGIWF